MSAAWWQWGVVYQVYPRSFQDTNGDGIGDLAGIEQHLDYLADLGVDALWISPIYPSPMADFGYDVADHCEVDPRFGTLADFDRLLSAAHARGLKIILDYVPNHTSNRHPWFLESRSARTSPKRDWYLWRDAAPGGQPPNNWISDFGGPAWTWDEATGQYYAHAFLKEQPDLNWRNPEVQRAMFDVLRFWFARGVDGFRIDVLWHIFKAKDFRDNPANPDYRPGRGEMHRVLQTSSTDQPEVHGVVAEMRRIADGFGARVLIGEVCLPLEKAMRYYGTDGEGIHLPFNFRLVDATPAEWSAAGLAAIIGAYETALPEGAWPNWVLGSHDAPRIAARRGDAQARVAAMLLLTLRGTPTLYQGDELAIGAVHVPPSSVQDPRELREPGLGLGRDPSRTPMAWNAEANAGFSGSVPWLPLHDDWLTRNVAHMWADRESTLSLYRRLLALRRAYPALSRGDCVLLPVQGAVLGYVRAHGPQRLLVVLNLGSALQSFTLPAWATSARVLLSTLPGDLPPASSTTLHLRPDEGLILAPSPAD